MGSLICSLCVSLAVLLTGCGTAASPVQAPPDSALAVQRPTESPGAAGAALPGAVLDSYYAAKDGPAFTLFQKRSMQRFLAMWVEKAIPDLGAPVWDLDSFTELTVLDHSLEESRPEEQLYCCTFSDGGDRFGYIIVKYEADGPAMGNWSVTETTPYRYDLRANLDAVAESLADTGLDLETASASRVYLFDREKNRADQVIRFTDKSGESYFCYFGNDAFETELWEAG